MAFIFSCFIIIIISLIPILIVLGIFVLIKSEDQEPTDSSCFKRRCHHSLYFGHRWMDGFELDD